MTEWTRMAVVADFVLALVINTSAMLLGGAAFELATWYRGCAAAFFTNVILQFALPVPAFGRLVGRPLEGRCGQVALSVFAENLVFVTCISLVMAGLNTGGTGLVEAWLATYVPLVLVGYVTSLVLHAVGARVEGRTDLAGHHNVRPAR